MHVANKPDPRALVVVLPGSWTNPSQVAGSSTSTSDNLQCLLVHLGHIGSWIGSLRLSYWCCTPIFPRIPRTQARPKMGIFFQNVPGLDKHMWVLLVRFLGKKNMSFFYPQVGCLYLVANFIAFITFWSKKGLKIWDSDLFALKFSAVTSLAKRNFMTKSPLSWHLFSHNGQF